MPGTVELIEELSLRVQSREGYFLATFTPKVRNDRIRKLVDASKPPFSQKYRLSMMDNPAMSDEAKAAKFAELQNYSDAYRNTVLYGEWSGGDSMVFDFNSDKNCAQLPDTYSRAWRHVASADPAVSSKFGLLVFAEDPATAIWYMVKEDYISNVFAPSDIVRRVEEQLKGYNISKRVCDSHESWFIGEAFKAGYTWCGVYNKSNRKDQLILNLQQALHDGRLKVCPWCDKMIDEFVECHRDEDTGRIVAASRFHLLDSAQYFWDMKPRYERDLTPKTHDERILEQHMERKKVQDKIEKLKGSKGRITRKGSRW
jgi:hypothetical protein